MPHGGPQACMTMSAMNTVPRHFRFNSTTATRSVSETKEDIQGGADGAEQQHESSVSHSERIPSVANESKYKGQEEGDGGYEAELGELVRLQVQFVFKQKRYWNINQPSGGGTEAKENNQETEVEENLTPHGIRQGSGSDGDSRCCSCWTLSDHR